VRNLIAIVDVAPAPFYIHEFTVDETRLLDRLGRLRKISPLELRELPKVFRRSLAADEMSSCSVRVRLALSESLTPMGAAASDWCEDQYERTQKHITDVLVAHRNCINEALKRTAQEGALLRPGQCVVAGAVAMWRMHWRTEALRHQGVSMIGARVWSTLRALQRRGLIALPQAVEPQLWPELWNIIAHRLLISTLLDWVALCEKVLHPPVVTGVTEAQTSRLISDLIAPPIFARPTNDNAGLEVFHAGDVFLAQLNERGCATAVRREPRSRGVQTRGDETNLRDALDHGLTFAQLVVRAFPQEVASATPGRVNWALDVDGLRSSESDLARKSYSFADAPAAR
jgi:hypothetical protein